MPEVIVIGESGAGPCRATSTVESITQFAVLEIESDEVDVQDVGHVEYHPIIRRRLQLYAKFRPEFTSTHSQF